MNASHIVPDFTFHRIFIHISFVIDIAVDYIALDLLTNKLIYTLGNRICSDI